MVSIKRAAKDGSLREMRGNVIEHAQVQEKPLGLGIHWELNARDNGSPLRGGSDSLYSR